MRHLLEAGAEQPGQPDDLAHVHRERDVADTRAGQAVDGDAHALLGQVGVPHLAERGQPTADDHLDEAAARSSRP